MRIGLFSDTYYPEINGVANSTHILAQQLEKYGHQVFIVTTGKDAGNAKWDEDGKILRLSGMELKSLYGYVMTGPFHIHAMEEIKKLNLDIIHVQTEFGVGIFAKIASQQLRIPLVRTSHTTYEDYTHYVNFINSKTVDNVAKKMLSSLARLYSDSSIEVIAPSEKTKQLLENYGVKADIDVIPTGLMLDDFHIPLSENKKKEIRESFGYSLNDRLIIYVGRIASEKSLNIVLEGYEEAVKNGTNVKMLIVGGGPDLENLKKWVIDHQLENNVKFSGPVPSEQVPLLYHSADAFVSASLSETQGMTFVEALASGLPLFARKDDVLDGLLIENKTGWFFEDAKDFGSKILSFETIEAGVLEEMGKQAVLVSNPYNADVFGKKILEVYERVVNDFQNLYTIDDVKVKNDTVQVYLIADSKQEELRLKTSIEDYYDEGLRRGGVLTARQVEHLKKREAGAAAYQRCIRKLAAKDRTRKEIYDWLTQKTDCDIETINKIVKKLETLGYIDDERYCAEQIAKMNSSLYGRKRMIEVLKNKGLSVHLIEETLNKTKNTEFDKAKEYAEKLLRQSQKDSLNKTRNAIKSKMIKNGFDSDTIEAVVKEMDTSKQEMAELDNLRKCIFKAKKRYEKKYSGYELRNRIFRYCGAQGYKSDDIYALLDEMEWKKDDED